MKIELSGAKVTIKDALTWGDTQKIQSTIMGGAKISGKANQGKDVGFDFDSSTMLEAKYVALECAVEKIEEDGEEKEFSRDWMNSLSNADGTKLEKAVDELQGKDEGTTIS